MQRDRRKPAAASGPLALPVFISHDLSMVRHIANRVAAMYLGRIVELADRDASVRRARMRTLELAPRRCCRRCPSRIPAIEARRQRIVLSGDVPSPSKPHRPGCAFSTRCAQANAPLPQRGASAERGGARPAGGLPPAHPIRTPTDRPTSAATGCGTIVSRSPTLVSFKGVTTWKRVIPSSPSARLMALSQAALAERGSSGHVNA